MSARILYISREVALADKQSLKRQKLPRNPYPGYLLIVVSCWAVAGMAMYAIWRAR